MNNAAGVCDQLGVWLDVTSAVANPNKDEQKSLVDQLQQYVI